MRPHHFLLVLALWASLLTGCFKQRICNVNHLNIKDIKGDPRMNTTVHFATAREVTPYAFMALYAYDNWDVRKKEKAQTERKFIYQLPANLHVKRRINLPSGFQAVVFHRVGEKQKSVEVIVAFRGTDQASDWINGNIGERQYAEAIKVYEAERAKWPGLPVNVTGHSLGGGLALYISWLFPQVKAYLFNPSFKMPKAFKRPKVLKNRRIIVNEKGDILQLQRDASPPPQGITRTVVYDFTKCGTPIANHSMIYLLHGLLLMVEHKDFEVKGILTDFYDDLEDHRECEKVYHKDTKTYYCWHEDHVGLMKYGKTYRNNYKKRDYFQRHKKNYVVAGFKDTLSYVGDQNSQWLFQVSAKVPAIWIADLYIHGTLRSFWNAYSEGNGFREHNLNPGIYWQYENLRVGFEHESNGRADELSRKWNRLYAEAWLEWRTFKVLGKAWYIAPFQLENNEDIQDYLGNFELTLLAAPFNKKWVNFEAKLRKGTSKEVLRGSIELGLVLRLGRVSWSIANHEGLYIQYFYGYGMSLIDYNQKVSSLRIGFMFSFD